MGLAVGQIGLSVKDFLNLTPAEFDEIVKMWQEKIETETKTNWEQTRTIAYTIARQNDVKNKIPTPLHFMPFPWDTKKEQLIVKKLSKQQQEKRFRYLIEKWK